MNRVETAKACFREGFNCSQSIFSTFGQMLGLDRETSLKIAQAFGGGMARMGETCGAVTGAFLVIGLKHGKTRADDDEAKEKTYALVRKFCEGFQSRHGSIKCRDLLDLDISTPEGLKLAEEQKLFEIRCPEFIQSSAELLESLLSA